jgi:Kdo2-lipid IVA lauroyltransferase/acyltransferase
MRRSGETSVRANAASAEMDQVRREGARSAPRHRVFDLLEARTMAAFFATMAILPLGLASAAGGAIARLIGPRLAVTRRALRNLDLALPHLSEAERRRIVRDMWDNLGRIAAEYPHLARLRCFAPGTRVEVVGMQHIDRAVARGRPLIFFSGHFGNWEVACVAIRQYGLELVQVYRGANNPDLDATMRQLRRSLGVEPVRKGAAGARRIITALRQGRNLALLVDQKMNDGIAVPFFAREAMTAPAMAELALRYDCSMLPMRVDRLRGARFRFTIFPALDFARSGDRHADIRAVMTEVNRRLEQWIRERPGQWFWLHRRWPES